jgi:hypothetical protein
MVCKTGKSPARLSPPKSPTAASASFRSSHEICSAPQPDCVSRSCKRRRAGAAALVGRACSCRRYSPPLTPRKRASGRRPRSMMTCSGTLWSSGPFPPTQRAPARRAASVAGRTTLWPAVACRTSSRDARRGWFTSGSRISGGSTCALAGGPPARTKSWSAGGCARRTTARMGEH